MSFSTVARPFCALALFTFVAGCNSTSSNGPTTTTLPTIDAAFVTGAGESSNAEIAAANLAMQKSQNADVLAFAKQMITDHTQENTDLAATTQGLLPSAPPPTMVSSLGAAEATKLMPLTGPAFDKEYVNDDLQGHLANLSDNYNNEIAGGQYPSIVAYAQKYQPQVAMHRDMLVTIKAKYSF